MIMHFFNLIVFIELLMLFFLHFNTSNFFIVEHSTDYWYLNRYLNENDDCCI